jgi:hypothetical protein
MQVEVDVDQEPNNKCVLSTGCISSKLVTYEKKNAKVVMSRSRTCNVRIIFSASKLVLKFIEISSLINDESFPSVYKLILKNEQQRSIPAIPQI